MKCHIHEFFRSKDFQQSTSQHIGLCILRVFVGLAFCTFFEKLLPREGIWGPQQWFIADVANMGFPLPVFFAWLAVLSEFIGGLLLILGLFTRMAALLNAGVSFTAAFMYHKGDISGSGLMAFSFMIMCISILFSGPGKYSLAYFINRPHKKTIATKAVLLLLLLFFHTVSTHANGSALSITPVHTGLYKDSSAIRFYLKHNQAVPKKYTLIIYNAAEEGNNTRIKWFLPFQKMRFQLPAGSKIYIASSAQVAVVMQGNRIDGDKPFLVVEEKLQDKIVSLQHR